MEKSTKDSSNNRSLERRKRRERKKRRPFLFFFRWLIGLIVGIGLIGIYLVMTHPYFDIDYITLSGAAKTTKEQLLEGTDIKEGNNLFRISANKAKEKILQIKEIENVEIERKIPNRIHINVVEKYNFGYFESNGKTYIVTGQSEVRPYENEEKEDMVLISGISIEDIDETRKLSEDSFLRTLNEAILSENLYPYIREINVANSSNIILTLKDETQIELGEGDNLFNKLSILRKILEQEEYAKNGFEKIIINSNQQPTFVPRQGSRETTEVTE